MSNMVLPANAGVTAVGAAEARVARAGVAFSASVRAATLVGRETTERLASAVRPLLLGAGILVGTLVVVRLWRGSRQTRTDRPSALWMQSPWSALARSAGVALATMAARRLAERWLVL